MTNSLESFLGRNERVFVYLILLILGTYTNGQEQLSTKTSYQPLADHLLAKIKDDNWSEDETNCYYDIIRLFEAARNRTLWAIWILDSMQLPVGALYGSRYHLGNYDQCLDDRWSSSHPELETQYCFVDVTSQEQSAQEFNPYGDAEAFAKSKSIYGRRRYLNSIGVCVPASCSPNAVQKLSSNIVGASHLPYGEVSVDPRNCQRATSNQMAYSFGFYFFWFIIIILIATAATVYAIEDYITNPKLAEIAAFFSPSKNFESLVDTRPNQVFPLHGIRVISSIVMVIMHYMYMINTLTVINQDQIGKDASTALGRPVAHLEILINSFTVLTGFLFVRAHCHSETLKPLQVLYKRYQRFIVPYAMVIFYVVSVSPHTGSGPLWPRYLKLEHEPCIRNWWSGLLMMFDSEDICYITSWYISCDFQLNILGLIIICCWRKDQKKGIMLFFTALVSAMGFSIFRTYWYRLPPHMIYDTDLAFDMTQNQVFKKIFSNTFSNTSSYFIGFAMGYIMTIYKPEHNRKIFSKRTSTTVSLALGFLVIKMMNTIGSLLFKPYDSFIYAWYADIGEVVWSTALCGLVVLCEYGTLPVITDFLGGKAFVACSRLSYGVYLIHMALINRNLFSLRAPVTYDFINWIVEGLGYATVSFMLSYLQWFIIEAPAANVFNYFQKNRDRNKHTKPIEKLRKLN